MHTKLLNLNYLRTFLMFAVMLLTTATAWAVGPIEVNNWAALKDAISNGAVIELAGDDVYLALGSSISIDVEGTVTIDGKGHTIDAVGLNDRIFVIDDGATLILKNLTLKNAVSSNDGGAIYIDQGTLTVDNCTFTNNTATSENGGAIYNHQGTLKITNSTFDKNGTYDRAIYNYAYDEENLFKLTILNTTMIEDKVCVNYNDMERRLDDKRNIDLLTTEFKTTMPEIIYAGTDGTATVPISVTVDSDYNGNDEVNIVDEPNNKYDKVFNVVNGKVSITLNILEVKKYTARFKQHISLTQEAFENQTYPYERISFKVVTDSSFSALQDKIDKAIYSIRMSRLSAKKYPR